MEEEEIFEEIGENICTEDHEADEDEARTEDPYIFDTHKKYDRYQDWLAHEYLKLAQPQHPPQQIVHDCIPIFIPFDENLPKIGNWKQKTIEYSKKHRFVFFSNSLFSLAQIDSVQITPPIHPGLVFLENITITENLMCYTQRK